MSLADKIVMTFLEVPKSKKVEFHSKLGSKFLDVAYVVRPVHSLITNAKIELGTLSYCDEKND